MHPGRLLAYRFFELPHTIKFEIAWKLDLIEDGYGALTDTELFRRALKRARDTDCLDKLWDIVQEKHGDGLHTENPYRNTDTKLGPIKYMVL